MDTDPFDTLTARLNDQLTRRRSLGLLGVAGMVSAQDAIAGKKKRRKRKKKKPAMPGPVTRADASCIATNPLTAGVGYARVAQTFRALRTGQLTAASFLLQANGAGMDFDVEIWSVDADNVPAAFLGGTTIADVPETVSPNQRQLTATMPTPVPVVAGTRYALVVTKGVNAALVVSADNPCADGMIFYGGPGEPYFPAPAIDLHFGTVVAA